MDKIATLHVSGLKLTVGVDIRPNPTENSITFNGDEMIEPMFINATEAKMLVAALTLAIKVAEEITPNP